MRAERYQIALVICMILVAGTTGLFLYDELFPEYKVYQNGYEKVEEFRSTYTGEAPPHFSSGIKQVVITREDKGPETVDRCISCHVTLQFAHFSPTKPAIDDKGNTIFDADGKVLLVPNEEYVWSKLNEQIASTEDPQKKEELKALRFKKVDGFDVDMSKVLVQHPLIGREVLPFEHHPIDTYGCTVCHSGNGLTVTSRRAHGPTFDDQYEGDGEIHLPPFIEHDNANDPKFARMFNSRPNHELRFQTTPLLIGALMQAKCAQCHQPGGDEPKEAATQMKSSADPLMHNLKRGKELYFTQACYACHRIDLLSRGVIGPDLSAEGFNYPWYIKLSILWPQGKMPSSAMPTFKIDHEEAQDLMTFLVAQTRQAKSSSPMEKKASLKAWENGRLMPWEKPIPPSEMHNIREGMMIFATEGCAACHRLKGFTSSVGYSAENSSAGDGKERIKDKESEWFTGLFPQQIRGSELVSVIDAHTEGLAQRIAPNVHEEGMLEEIEKKHPHTIESYFLSFKYAMRAKDAQYRDALNAATNPEEKVAALDALNKWKKQVTLVRTMYIQEYGLGRDIAPPLTYSGIFRSNEWLMGHFRNPSDYSARSIMPVMPFDESKFVALTHMLHQLAKLNRDQLREVWRREGFHPELAVQHLCAPCHGDLLHGNGPVAEAIYPVPKNLRNALFLRNLTEESAQYSIAHGVKGTPMPPWGEVAAESEVGDAIPILTAAEINQIVDYLYHTLPGSEGIKEEKGVGKWSYSPADIVGVMKKDGQFLTHAEISEPSLDTLQEDVTTYFAVRPTPKGKSNIYMLKREYYTPENLAKGRDLFIANCAECHGKDATGSGNRAAIMTDAKPRALTNEKWISSRDDLALLRSITFGIQGTSMPAWAEKTTMLQRMQAVLYIRSLTMQKKMRSHLEESLYSVFDLSGQLIEDMRINEYSKVAEVKKRYDAAASYRAFLYQQLQGGVASPSQVAEAYAEELRLLVDLEAKQKVDGLVESLLKEVDGERLLFEGVGISFLSDGSIVGTKDELIEAYSKLITSYAGKYTFVNGALALNVTAGMEEQAAARQVAILAMLQQQIDSETQQLEETGGSAPLLKRQIEKLGALRDKFVFQLDETKKSRQRQQELYNQLASSCLNNVE